MESDLLTEGDDIRGLGQVEPLVTPELPRGAPARLHLVWGDNTSTLARDNLAQDGQKLCPWLDSLILTDTDQKYVWDVHLWLVENVSDNFLPMCNF